MLLGEMLVNYLYSAVHMAIEKIPVAGAEIYHDAQFLDAKEASDSFMRF